MHTSVSDDMSLSQWTACSAATTVVPDVGRLRKKTCYCRRTLTRLGPSFIKAGQVLASRPDIVRADYMEELCTLQDDVPSFPDDIVSCPFTAPPFSPYC